jgi:hypothetical protein
VLLEAGHRLVVLDNFSNSSPEALRRVAELADLQTPAKQERLQVLEGDIRNPADLDRAFAAGAPVAGVIHFAGLKAVGESVQQHRHGVWGARAISDHRGVPHQPAATLCANQAGGGVDAGSPRDQRAGLVHQPAALLQPGGCPPERADRGRSAGHPQQPVPVSHAGGLLNITADPRLRLLKKAIKLAGEFIMR